VWRSRRSPSAGESCDAARTQPDPLGYLHLDPLTHLVADERLRHTRYFAGRRAHQAAAPASQTAASWATSQGSTARFATSRHAIARVFASPRDHVSRSRSSPRQIRSAHVRQLPAPDRAWRSARDRSNARKAAQVRLARTDRHASTLPGLCPRGLGDRHAAARYNARFNPDGARGKRAPARLRACARGDRQPAQRPTRASRAGTERRVQPRGHRVVATSKHKSAGRVRGNRQALDPASIAMRC
jgi:hypothetical protein